ncbi:MAG: 4,5-DOPA dioxygenase extradiol [Gammaproteobacteria bacterium]|nr:4,5-DOPA dioxygenase extradiol [Gammaproteobacteria bacterium]
MGVRRMPALFLGHGSPLQALQPNRHTAVWQQLGRDLPSPRAILCISAHWYTRGTGVTSDARPKTVHDFYGFPPELYRCRYPAAGDPALAARVQALLAPDTVHAVAEDWGLDHGCWQVLMYLYPRATVPVVQLSIDSTRPPADHYALGARLAPLRDSGVLILGSGNVVHNLRTTNRRPDAPAPPLALEFESRVRAALCCGDHEALVQFERAGHAAAWSVPTPDHYLPLLYVLGAAGRDAPVSIPTAGIELGAVSMLSALFDAGSAAPLPAHSTLQKQ